MNPIMPVTDYGQNYRIMQEWDNGTVNPCEKDVENLRRTLTLGSLCTWGILWPLGSIVADVKKYSLISDEFCNLINPSVTDTVRAMPSATAVETAKKVFVGSAINKRTTVLKNFSLSLDVSILGKTALQVSFFMLGVSLIKLIKEQELQPQSLWGIGPLLLGGGLLTIAAGQRDSLRTRFMREASEILEPVLHLPPDEETTTPLDNPGASEEIV